MNYAAFFSRFTDECEIGRDTDNEDVLSIFYDDGKDVGVYRENRRTTAPIEVAILDPESADCARGYYGRKRITHHNQLHSLNIDEVNRGYDAGLRGDPEPSRRATDSEYHGWIMGAVDGKHREKDEYQIALDKSVQSWLDRTAGRAAWSR